MIRRSCKSRRWGQRRFVVSCWVPVLSRRGRWARLKRIYQSQPFSSLANHFEQGLWFGMPSGYFVLGRRWVMICKLYQFRLFSPPPHKLQTRIRLGIPLRHRQALLETEQGKKIFWTTLLDLIVKGPQTQNKNKTKKLEKCSSSSDSWRASDTEAAECGGGV